MRHAGLRLTVLLAGMLAFTAVAQVRVEGTRFVFHQEDADLSIPLRGGEQRPSLIQVWIEPETGALNPAEVKLPLFAVPPLLRIDERQMKVVRLRAVREQLPIEPREQLYWLNIQDVPPSHSSEGDAVGALRIAARHRFKLIYRPTGVSSLRAPLPAEVSFSLRCEGGRSVLKIDNALPNYLNFAALLIEGAGGQAALQSMYVGPGGTLTVPLHDGHVNGYTKVTYDWIDDMGEPHRMSQPLVRVGDSAACGSASQAAVDPS